ncbi:MAG TPA: toprim domain-containing protein, partial [Methylocella sp.]
MADFLELIEPVARSLLGETNKSLSTSIELRFGTHGSMTVKIGGARRGTWYNHELNSGGGTIDLVKSQLGCGDKEAFDWLRREFGDLAGAPERSTGDRKIVATYPYVDETGATLFEVVRHEPKEFRQRRPDGNGFVWNVKGVRQVPYRLPELIEAISLSHPVFIVEGEKDVDALASLNFPATCNAGGAGKWRREFASFFEGADVILLPDNDAAGRDHMGKVARALEGTAARIRELDLPDLPRKGDVSDWLAAGGTPEALLALIDGAQDWKAKPVTRLPAIWYGDEDSVAPLSWLVKGLFVNG